ncbi:NAD(P)H-dependent glycerol-3-phosphate dehydrogenase [Cognatishimia activa]|uniref:Glycerol-3-phosphate dehydrogenase [NAD(P)+] n=1 Tax=Cognatishimia activa TaxID=1715691 RepID=A0A975ES39_9RHOB|nr:NAD(P)H-dependent glycerol-3-phosphate dehydrogenase [Cognatishimia activa]QTN37129.1 NAD(P)-dependent glycerol-3-phosphate dehydrogenase [Cognatishimia activa]
MSILVLGAGAFGTSLAQSFALGGTEVTLWGRDADSIAAQDRTRQSARLKDVRFSDLVTLTPDLPQDLPDVVLLAVPLQTLRSVLASFPQLNGKTLVACCKGIELSTGKGPVSIIQDIYPDATGAILTGPSFAQDIAIGLPTALTLACADDAKGQALQDRLKAPNLRIYRTTDVIGAELGGALKNVIAIACGAAIGAGLGESARAALMTRGFAEMKRMAHALGADRATLSGLSGFGDLSLTCSSTQSRNYQFGLALGRGEPFDPNITVEGAATARATLTRATGLGLDMPITQAIVGLLDQKLNLSEAMEQLLARPPKEE